MNSIYAECLMTLKNSKPNQIPEYPTETINKAKEQINELMAEIRKERKEKYEDERERIYQKGKVAAKLDTLHRIKRFLLIVHEFRSNKIQELFWNFGGEVKPSELANMSEKQKQYLLKYKKMTNKYINDVNLQITMDIEPAIDTVVEIKVVNDCGEIMGFGQMIKLEKNSVHFVKRKFVENLIQKGDIQVLK